MVGLRGNGADGGSRRRIRTGIAISQTELCAADTRLGDSHRGWRAPLEPPPPENGHWPSLAAALTDLARKLGVTEGTLAVSLLPPFTEARRLELPPLRDDELQRLLARGASRYFVAVKGPPVVGASMAARRVRGAPTPVIAAAASARLVGAIRSAAADAGWTIEVVAPAEGAWAAAAMRMWPSFSRHEACVLVAHGDRTDLLQIADGRLAGVRRFRAGATDAAMVADAIAPSLSPVNRSAVRVGVFGDSGQRRQLSAALAAHGISVSVPAGEWGSVGDRPEALAARFAGTEIGPVLRSEDRIVAEREQLRRVTWWISGVARFFCRDRAMGGASSTRAGESGTRADPSRDFLDDGRAHDRRRRVPSPDDAVGDRARVAALVGRHRHADRRGARRSLPRRPAHARRLADRRRIGRTREAGVRCVRES